MINQLKKTWKSRSLIIMLCGFIAVILIVGNTIRINNNKRLASTYLYNVMDDTELVKNYVDAIDLFETVEVQSFKVGTILSQYKKPNEKQGKYYTCSDCNPNKLGIITEGKVKKIYVVTQTTTGLKSRAKSKTWNIGDTNYHTKGGELQYYIPCLECIEVLTILSGG